MRTKQACQTEAAVSAKALGCEAAWAFQKRDEGHEAGQEVSEKLGKGYRCGAGWSQSTLGLAGHRRQWKEANGLGQRRCPTNCHL